VSRASAEESILRLLSSGYQLAPAIYHDYVGRRDDGTFDREGDVARYREMVSEWRGQATDELLRVFPTDFEAQYVNAVFSVSAADYLDVDNEVAALVYGRILRFLDKLQRILDTHLPRYSDLPLRERLFIEDADSFSRVRDVNPAMVAEFLKAGRIELAEDEVQMGLEAILNVPFHKKDWGGEVNDLYTANLVLNGARRPTSFLLKGNGLKSAQLTIADCGKNGDQIVRLFGSPAELFVVQYIGPIHGKVTARRAAGGEANYLIIDGQDTARLLYAYNRLTD
jgi:hypothetical protein